MASMNNESTPVVKKETKNRISVDFEGKLTFKERMKQKLKASNTWITAGVNVVRFILMLGVSFVILYPFIARIANSFMSKTDVLDATVSLIPKNPTLEIYKAIIVENGYFDAFFNTLLLSLMCAIIQTMVSCLVGYGLAKFKFKGNTAVMLTVIITMAIPHVALYRSIAKHFEIFDIGSILSFGNRGIFELISGQPLNFVNTFWPMFILSIGGLAFKNGLYIYLMRQFFKGVPDELEESAYVDGSGVYRTFFSIILPLAVPMMITIFLFSFSWQWTDVFYHGLFFQANFDGTAVALMPDIIAMPASLTPGKGYGEPTLYNSIVSNTGAMLVILPLIIMYLFCQRYLVEGIERSGIVG